MQDGAYQEWRALKQRAQIREDGTFEKISNIDDASKLALEYAEKYVDSRDPDRVFSVAMCFRHFLAGGSVDVPGFDEGDK